jgi:hypothetical protein
MSPVSALDRAIKRAGRRREAAGDRCDLCGLALPEAHRHLLDDRRAELACACRACSLLFERAAAGGHHYRLVPERRVRLDDRVSAQELGVPVGLAFFVSRADGTVVAHYPSPVGATQWEVDPPAWQRVVEGHPELAGIEADVEAFLLDTVRGADERWIVPIDDCYRLVAVIKRAWKGLSGGTLVWGEIETFFADLAGTAGSAVATDGGRLDG